MPKQIAGTNPVKQHPNKLQIWLPKSEADYLRVFEEGPTSCMSLKRNQCYLKSDEDFNAVFTGRWDSFDFYYKNWHPGLFYHDIRDIQIVCLIDPASDIIYCRANLWHNRFFGSLYGEFTGVLANYLEKKVLVRNIHFSKIELPLCTVPGRLIRIANEDHYLLPWAFCDDWSHFKNRPNVGFDDATKSFLISTKPIPNSLQITNDYAFNGFISNWDIKTKWRVPVQDYTDVRKRTSDYWNSQNWE